MFYKIGVQVSQISQEDICVGVFFNKVAEPSKPAAKGDLNKGVSCEICAIFKHTFF